MYLLNALFEARVHFCDRSVNYVSVFFQGGDPCGVRSDYSLQALPTGPAGQAMDTDLETEDPSDEYDDDKRDEKKEWVSHIDDSILHGYGERTVEMLASVHILDMFGLQKKKSEIYADHAAGSPMDPRVRNAMLPWMDASWNPSAIHPRGVKAQTAIEDARKSVAKLLYAHPDEITFTSSATESIHLALSFYALLWEREKVPHVITTPIEHHSLLEPLQLLAKQERITLDYLTLLPDGTIDSESLRALLKPSTVLTAVMSANNETGVIQPIRAVTKIVRDHKKAHKGRFPYVLTDACQSFLSLEQHVERLGVDYLVLNGAKVGGPEGTALLYARRGAPVSPMQRGGGQERGLRAGTENVAGIIGFIRALEIAQEEREVYEEKVRGLRDALQEDIHTIFPDAHVNGVRERLPGHLNVTFPECDHQYLALALGEHGIMVGTKSACRENEDGGSHVLQALRKAGDVPDLLAEGIRISLGKGNTFSDIPRIMKVLSLVVPLARKSKMVMP